MTEAPLPTPAPNEPVREAQAAAALLKQLFPALFAGTPKPIKLRIQQDIEARAPGKFTRAALTAFLRRHTGSTSYLVALTKAQQRFDLDGQPAGELSAEHRAAAEKALAERRERLRARDAEMETARRWRADLLRDWGRSSFSRAAFCALKGVQESALNALLEQAKQEAAQAPAKPAGNERRGPRPPQRPPRPQQQQRPPRGNKPDQG